MSALIKGLEPSALPGGDVIRAEIRLMDGEVRLGIMTGGYACAQVWTFYPLVEIPPHGRLIDADALMARCKDEKGKYKSYEAAVIGESVELFPTIIEAEGE